MKYRTREFVSFLVLIVLSAQAILMAGPAAHAQTEPAQNPPHRRLMQMFEAPSPDPAAPWNQVRREQLTFLERLKEWGIEIEVEKKDELAIENSPNLFTFAMAWTAPGKIEISAGMKTPKNSINESASFKYKGEFSGEGTSSETSGQFEFYNGTKFEGGLTSDARRGLGYELGFELEKAFITIKGKLASSDQGLVSYPVEVSLTKLYNFTQDIAGGSEHAANIKIKIHPITYLLRFIQFAPRFISLAEVRAERAFNAVTFKFNPILVDAARTNDPSLWNKQKAVELVRQGLQEELPKGVRIHFNENLLAELLYKGGTVAGRDGLSRLAVELEKTPDQEARAKLIETYIRGLKEGYLATRPSRVLGSVTLISLRALVTAAEPYASTWTALPEDLRAPGGISRIVGYELDPAHADVLLIGEVIPGAPVLTIDDLVVGVRSAWKDNATPFCSLDPDPADMGGNQNVRVSGVPVDSGFAKVMLDADYLMKRLMAGLVPVNSAGYQSYAELSRNEIKSGRTAGDPTRFWFYPAPLQTGDIELSRDGSAVLFNTSVQVLSEQMVLSREGLIGTGKVGVSADKAAADLTQSLPSLELPHPEFRHLHGLFDIVLLSKVWQRQNIESPWITRLAGLPYKKETIPTAYKGITVTIAEDQARGGKYVLMGGVNVRMSAGPHAWLVKDQPQLTALRTAAGVENAVARKVIGSGLILPSGAIRQPATMDVAAILALARRGNTDRARTELEKLIKADPFDSEARCVRALINLQVRSYEAALADAARAMELDPDNPNTMLLALIVRFQVHYLIGNPDLAFADIDLATRLLPESARAHILKGDALVALARAPEARSEYRKALELEPNSVMANVSFGLLEISEGYVVRARKFVEKARLQAKVEAEIPAVKAALALAELGVAILGDPESHLASSRQYALEVLADPAASPDSRIRALAAQTIIALIRDNLPAAEVAIREALLIAPSNPEPLLVVASWAHEQKRDDVARHYLSQAEKVAPRYPAVIELRALLGGSR